MRETPYRPYQNLRVYPCASALASDLFWITRRFPAHDPFGLTDQLRRTMRALLLNIAQGWKKRYNVQDFRNHLGEAQSACALLGLWLDVAHERWYLTDAERKALHTRKATVQRMLTRLHDQRIAMLAASL